MGLPSLRNHEIRALRAHMGLAQGPNRPSQGPSWEGPWEAHMGLPSLRNHEIRALRAHMGPGRAQIGLPRAWAQALGRPLCRAL